METRKQPPILLATNATWAYSHAAFRHKRACNLLQETPTFACQRASEMGKQPRHQVKAVPAFASSYTGPECCRLPAGPGNDNEGPRPMTAVHVFGVGQATFYETREIVGQGRGGQTDNKRSGRMTTSDVVPFGEAAFYETRKVVGRYQLARRDNKGACGRTAAHFVASETAAFNEPRKVVGHAQVRGCDNKRARRRTAAHLLGSPEAAFYETGNVFGLSPGQVSDNKWARCTKRRKSSAWPGAAGMTTTGRVAQRPRVLSLRGRLLPMATSRPVVERAQKLSPRLPPRGMTTDRSVVQPP